MTYKAIGIMSGSSTDGLDLAYVVFEENQNKWNYEILHAECIVYATSWKEKLKNAETLSAKEYFLLNNEYGKYVAEIIRTFIEKNDLDYKVQLIGFHGHTVFHDPSNGISIQLGDGAVIAATTGINTISEMRSLDVALGGQGAPIVPLGEKLLFPEYVFFLNIGGIANISFHNNSNNSIVAFDVCPANKVLDVLASQSGKVYDENGKTSSLGNVNEELLQKLNTLEFYKKEYPKSLSNHFGTEIVLPLINSFNISNADQLRTYSEHICQQIIGAIKSCTSDTAGKKIFVTGGGAYNIFLIEMLKLKLGELSLELVEAGNTLIEFKEALIMALLAVLRWREESTTILSVTGATRAGIGGACWMGQDA